MTCNYTIMQFCELTDRQSLLPQAYAGRLRADDRTTINGILYVLMSGCRWVDTCRPNMAPTRQSGSAIKNGVNRVSGRQLWIPWFRMAMWLYTNLQWSTRKWGKITCPGYRKVRFILSWTYLVRKLRSTCDYHDMSQASKLSRYVGSGDKPRCCY